MSDLDGAKRRYAQYRDQIKRLRGEQAECADVLRVACEAGEAPEGVRLVQRSTQDCSDAHGLLTALLSWGVPMESLAPHVRVDLRGLLAAVANDLDAGQTEALRAYISVKTSDSLQVK